MVNNNSSSPKVGRKGDQMTQYKTDPDPEKATPPVNDGETNSDEE